MSCVETVKTKDEDEAPSLDETYHIDTTPSDYKITWPDLNIARKYVRSNGWQKQLCPDVLRQLPSDIVVSEKVQQIMTWSMLAGDGWASKKPCVIPSSVTLDVGRSASIKPQNDNDNNKIAVTFDFTLAANSSAFDSAKDFTEDSPSVEKSPWSTKLLQKVGCKMPISLSQRVLTTEVVTRECTSCFDDLPQADLVRLDSCRHDYCKLCLTTLITTTMAAESLFPPKCCLTAIPLKTVLLTLSPDQRADYKAKSAEYSVPPTERWYCPRSTCSRWIPSSKLKLIWSTKCHCPYCSQEICRTCRGTAHDAGSDCPQDYGLEATLEMADAEGWVRCYKCRTLVEQTSGCRHMTCKCRAEFCYVCEKNWGTCHCTEGDADRKRDNVLQKRQNRNEAMEAEAAEIARAIAEVEELERREQEERRDEEVRLLREEEEILAILEAQRREEEVLRIAATEIAELEWLETIRSSFEDDYQQMRTAVHQIIDFQKTTLVSQHEAELIATISRNGSPQHGYSSQLSKVLEATTNGYVRRRDTLDAKHQVNMDALSTQQEQEEDDLFVRVQIRLRGKPNGEARMERMLDELRRQQLAHRQELQVAHQILMRNLDHSEMIDSEGLKRAQSNDLASRRSQHETEIRGMGRRIGADRYYFELITKRRLVMLARHGEIVRGQIEKKTEPTGLQEWQAVSCLPLLPEIDDGAPGPSRVSKLGHAPMTHFESMYIHHHDTSIRRKPVAAESSDGTPLQTVESVTLSDKRTNGHIQRLSSHTVPEAFPDDDPMPEVVVEISSPETQSESIDTGIEQQDSSLDNEGEESHAASTSTGSGVAPKGQEPYLSRTSSTLSTVTSAESDRIVDLPRPTKKYKWSLMKKLKSQYAEERRRKVMITAGDASY